LQRVNATDSYIAEVSRKITFSIADLSVTLFSDEPWVRVCAEKARESFVTAQADASIEITAEIRNLKEVEISKDEPPRKLFDSGALWQLYHDNSGYRFDFNSPAFGPSPYKVSYFNSDFTRGDIHLNQNYFYSGRPVDPLEYPLDELLFLNLLAGGKGVEVHGCGVVDSSGKGSLYIGHSGAGKSTIANLWNQEPGIKILSDDRIILRKRGNSIFMYGTPWHGQAQFSSPEKALVNQIFFLKHGRKNASFKKQGMDAVTRLFACSFSPFYSNSALDFTLAFHEDLVRQVPCNELQFVPDRTTIDFLRNDMKTI